MKKLTHLTKEEINQYMHENGFFFNTKRGFEDAQIKYLFENNSKEDIESWFNHKKQTMRYTPLDDEENIISVYMNNRIYEKLNGIERKKGMKQWKVEIVEKLSEEAKNAQEIYFYEFAKSIGYNHITTQDLRDIKNAFLKANPNFHETKIIKTKIYSLFTSLAFAKSEEGDDLN